ncbi:hypothetical protein [Vulgatibacter incomptus]|uniref:Alginate export domain-containing protein n=1 Tax=Vulgatibacter incomptus TaxID=1391653 RepID=A0A0K1PDF2_9BACT|nr:hypothetical protein [Vulgatibacter incomptus]AKU91550.1 hypothetical protein AKJ08_1937 [Vulgatibacter incomptus]
MRVAALAALLLLLPNLAAAESLRLLNTSVLEYRGDNGSGDKGDKDFGVGINKLYLDGQMDRTSVGVQVDAVAFTKYPDVPVPTAANPSAYRSEGRLKRIWLTHTLGDASVTLGDSYLQLGRGIALSLRKVDELGADQAMRGGALSWQGDTVSAKAFAGRTNVANLDTATQKFIDDPEDTLAGASGTVHVGRADVSVHGLYLQPKTPVLDDKDGDQTVLGGAFVDLPATDWLSIYFEGAMEQYRIARIDDRGTALYAAVDLDLQFASLLVEGLRLEKFRVMGSQNSLLQKPTAYNQPPTLERIDQEVLDSENAQGGRAKLSRSFLDGSLVVYTSGMFRRYGTASSLADAVHGYGGFELTYGDGGSRWYASGGYRQETLDGAASPFKTMVHGETDWVQAVGAGYALHLTVAHENRSLKADDASDAVDHVRGTTMVGFDKSRLGSLTAEIGYDTSGTSSQDFFLAGIAAWTPLDWLAMKAVFGSERGGLKCVGGVCREFPAFSGVRFEAAAQYDLF